MCNDLVSASYQGEYRIEVTFENGRKGIVDLLHLIENNSAFSRLKDVSEFKTFSVNVELGVLTWGDDLDIAPETIYSEATGESLPGWMQGEGAKQSA